MAWVYQRIQTRRRTEDVDEEKPGNSGPGKSGQNTRGSTTHSTSETLMLGSSAASQTIASHTTSLASTTMATSVLNPVIATSTNPCPVLQTTCMPTASLSSKASNQQLIFNDPYNTTTCGTLELSWVYGGQTSVPITLFVQDVLSNIRTLTNNTPSDAEFYIWSPVDIDEGWYSVNAFDTKHTAGISAAQSAIFFVSRGPDIKCLVSNTTAFISTTGFNTPTSPPTNFTLGSKTLGADDIIGISLGVTIGVAVLVLACVFPRLLHRDLPDPKHRRPYLLY